MKTLTKPPHENASADPPQATQGRRHLAGLDGLRAVAVIVVMLFHLTPGYLPGGYIGVDIFFVLSGFLITSLLFGEQLDTGRIALGMFWRRRARRLLPALVVLVPICSAAAWLTGGDVLVGLGKQVLGAATFSSNWLAIATDNSYFDEAMPDLLRNLWSLSVEEQFYLIWPVAILALLLIKNRGIRLALVVAGAAASAVAMGLLYSPNADATRVYYGTDTHSFGLAIGSALAILSQYWSPVLLDWSRKALVWLPIIGTAALGGLLAASVLLSTSLPVAYRGGLALVAVLTAMAISGCIVPGSFLGRALDIRPLRWIGERSYGLYLWHWPVYVLVFSTLRNWSRIGAGGWALGGIALCITVAAATLSYRFIEQPLRRGGFRATAKAMGDKLRRSHVVRIGAAAGTLLLLTAGTMTVGAIASAPGAGGAQLSIQAGQDAITRTAGPTPSASAGPSINTPVPLPSAPPLSGERVTAIGDSVMLASAPELQAALPGIAINAVVSRQMRQAPEIVQEMRDQGTLRHFVLIGLGTNGAIPPSTLEEIRDIAGQGHQIVFVNVYAPRGYVDSVNSALAQFAQRYPNVELADWHDAIINRLGLLSSDQIHPGKTGGQIYTDVVNQALQRLAALPALPGSTNRFAAQPR